MTDRNFEALLEHANEAIAVVTRDGRRVFVSKSVERVSGWTREEWLTLPSGAFVLEEDRPIFAAAIAAAWDHPTQTIPVRVRYTTPDGSVRWFDATFSNHEHDPAIGGLVANFRDVTEEVHAAEALAASERRFRAVIEHTADGVVFRRGSDVTLVNPAAVSILLGEEHLPGRTTPITLTPADMEEIKAHHIHPDDVAGDSGVLADLMVDPERTITTRFRVRLEDTWRWIEAVHTNQLDNPDLRCLVSHMRDITAEVNLHDRVASSELLFRSLTEHSTDGVTLRKGNSVTLINPAAVSLLSPPGMDEHTPTPVTLDPDQALAWYHHSFHPDDAERVRLAIEHLALQPHGVYRSHHRIRHGDAWRWVESVSVNHLDDPGIAAVITTVRDITRMKEAEAFAAAEVKAQTDANDLLREASRIKSQMLAMLSHEFRTPLTSIQGYADLIAEGLIVGDEAQDSAEIINREAKRLNVLISEMLQVEQLEQGDYTVHLAPCIPRAVAESAVRMLAGAWPDRVVTIESANADTPVRTDAGALLQIITNLVANALKYSPEGGSVILRIAVTGLQLDLQVKDHGIGIPQEDIERVFDRYARVKSPATAKIQGTGLGLTIVRRLAEALGGRAWAESTLGVGTTMHVTIALAD